jgi:hypothetical protein
MAAELAAAVRAGQVAAKDVVAAAGGPGARAAQFATQGVLRRRSWGGFDGGWQYVGQFEQCRKRARRTVVRRATVRKRPGEKGEKGEKGEEEEEEEEEEVVVVVNADELDDPDAPPAAPDDVRLQQLSDWLIEHRFAYLDRSKEPPRLASPYLELAAPKPPPRRPDEVALLASAMAAQQQLQEQQQQQQQRRQQRPGKRLGDAAAAAAQRAGGGPVTGTWGKFELYFEPGEFEAAALGSVGGGGTLPACGPDGEPLTKRQEAAARAKLKAEARKARGKAKKEKKAGRWGAARAGPSAVPDPLGGGGGGGGGDGSSSDGDSDGEGGGRVAGGRLKKVGGTTVSGDLFSLLQLWHGPAGSRHGRHWALSVAPQLQQQKDGVDAAMRALPADERGAGNPFWVRWHAVWESFVEERLGGRWLPDFLDPGPDLARPRVVLQSPFVDLGTLRASEAAWGDDAAWAPLQRQMLGARARVAQAAAGLDTRRALAIIGDDGGGGGGGGGGDGGGGGGRRRLRRRKSCPAIIPHLFEAESVVPLGHVKRLLNKISKVCHDALGARPPHRSVVLSLPPLAIAYHRPPALPPNHLPPSPVRRDGGRCAQDGRAQEALHRASLTRRLRARPRRRCRAARCRPASGHGGRRRRRGARAVLRHWHAGRRAHRAAVLAPLRLERRHGVRRARRGGAQRAAPPREGGGAVAARGGAHGEARGARA